MKTCFELKIKIGPRVSWSHTGTRCFMLWKTQPRPFIGVYRYNDGIISIIEALSCAFLCFYFFNTSNYAACLNTKPYRAGNQWSFLLHYRYPCFLLYGSSMQGPGFTKYGVWFRGTESLICNSTDSSFHQPLNSHLVKLQTCHFSISRRNTYQFLYFCNFIINAFYFELVFCSVPLWHFESSSRKRFRGGLQFYVFVIVIFMKIWIFRSILVRTS